MYVSASLQKQTQVARPYPHQSLFVATDGLQANIYMANTM